MTVRDLEWTAGVPERLEPGMVLRVRDGGVLLVGSLYEGGMALKQFGVTAWAWAIKPHELQWLESKTGRAA